MAASSDAVILYCSDGVPRVGEVLEACARPPPANETRPADNQVRLNCTAAVAVRNQVTRTQPAKTRLARGRRPSGLCGKDGRWMQISREADAGMRTREAYLEMICESRPNWNARGKGQGGATAAPARRQGGNEGETDDRLRHRRQRS